ncbi:MAG: Threonylcarbamoyl-AMP synthase [Methanomassiliicoccales archaeon PtaB.Bin134]|jgi:L-threonylcarbamoyladenylate synthase|nr:MAG: Threonylcarbamoyl-AMP synthase [Methanomassiliicoccales archaeon PtaB.Bin134]
MDIIKCKDAKSVDMGISKHDLEQILSTLHFGRLVVYPTETVYGLGADPFDETAVKRVFIAKRRPFDMPLSIAVHNISVADRIAELDENAYRLAKAFLPGPLTLLVKKRPILPDIVTASLPEVGIRIPDHPVALRMLEEFGPIISTSANVHSHPNPTTVENAIADLGTSVATYVDGGPCKVGTPSTIVQIIDGVVEVIRYGAISKEKIEDVLAR